MKPQVLIGADEFMQALGHRAQYARDSLYVQAMTFEGDAAGERLIDLMISSPAKDKRLIVDSFSKVVVSDRFVFGPKYLKDASFRAEIKNTNALLHKAEANGVQVRFVNPTGLLMTKYPLRNHKKMMMVDGRFSFLGGINFSDHNFDWHDMMVELDDLSIGEVLNDDFKATWEGKNQSTKIDLGMHQLYFFNGIKSKDLYDGFFDHVKRATESITVVSPYVSEPLLPALSEAAAKGVKVEIISPKENNKGLFHDYLLSQSEKGFFKLLHHPGMFHLKAILVDGSTLIFGSSNYDLVSYYFEQEVVFVSSDEMLVQEFSEKVLSPMKEASEVFVPDSRPSGRAELVMRLLKGFSRLASQSFLKPV